MSVIRLSRHFDSSGMASRCDAAIETMMVACIAFMPLAMGAVHAWSEMVVICLAWAMLACLMLKIVFDRRQKLVWTWAYVPMALFLAVAGLQLLPLSTGLVATISPATESTRRWLLGGEAAQNSAMTLSFYPQATMHDLRLVLAIMAIFFVTLNVYRTSAQIKRLLAAAAVVGGIVAMLALLQDISGAKEIFWAVPTGGQDATSGPFLNHSHYSQFMNLSIAAALALLLVCVQERFSRAGLGLAEVVELLSSRPMWVIWALAGVVVLGTASVFLSLSRGGMLSLLIAGTFTGVVLACGRAMKGRSWALAVVALLAFICVLWIGFDAVSSRLASLQQMKDQNRWQILRDIGTAWMKFPLLGTGLGSHEFVYPMFDRSSLPALASHAENEYAQAAEEMGAAGLLLVLAFLGIVIRNYIRNIRAAGSSASAPQAAIRFAAFGLGMGLLAVMIHSLSDFGQHLPANAALSAVFCALLIGLKRVDQYEETQHSSMPAAFINSKPIRALASIVVLATAFALVCQANDARMAESDSIAALRMEKPLRERNWRGDNDEYKTLIGHAASAADYQPNDVKHQYWLNVYRWRAISRVIDPRTNQIVMTGQSLEHAQNIVRQLKQARQLCPTFGPLYCLSGQIELFVLNSPDGAEDIRRGYALAPCDATACFAAGLLDARQGRYDDAGVKFARCLRLDQGYLPSVLDVYISQVDRPDLAVDLAKDNPGWLMNLVDALSRKNAPSELVQQAFAKIRVLLKARCEQPAAAPAMLASFAHLCRQDRDYLAAADYYRRALASEYGQVDWRLSLARCLVSLGQKDRAAKELDICLRLRPGFSPAIKLLDDLRGPALD